jgi:hypothetical protein
MNQHNITVGEFMVHIRDLAFDNPDLLNLPLNGLYVYTNGYDEPPVEILTDEEAAE